MTKLEKNELRRKAAAIIQESLGERNDRQTRNDLVERLATLLSEALLQESQESKSISQAVQLVLDRGVKQTKEEAEQFIRKDFREQIPVLRDKNAGKFVLGAVRMWLDGQLNEATTISRLNSTLKYVADPTHINEYDRNLNGLSAQELIDRFAPVRQAAQDKEREELNRQQYEENSAYKIIPVNSFEEATKYGKYNDWCLAQPNGEDMYDSYTAGGVNQLYVILRDGFENVPKQTGENTPYDDYGLSMMTVIVDPDGDMTQSTTRWNHQNGSTDSALTPKQVSEITGRNFYQTFKPNTKFKDAVAEALRKLSTGATPKQAFETAKRLDNGLWIVWVGRKCNVLDTQNHLLSQKWFDFCTDFQEGFARVQLDDKENFIDKDGKILSEQWFDACWDFSEGFAQVQLNGKLDSKLNLIDKDGKFLSEQWFDKCGIFSEGFARVQLNGKWNFIGKDGKFLTKQWFDMCGDFSEGFACVQLNGKWNFIGKDGKFLSKQWFDDCDRFGDGFAKVQLDGKWNFIGKDGKFLSKQWFDMCRYFHNGFAKVLLDGKWYNIDTHGRLTQAESLLAKAVNSVLKESQESKSISQAAQLILDRGIKKTKEDADKFVRVDFRGQIPALRDKNAGKFILGAVRMWIEGQLNSAAVISRLNTTLKFVADPTHINEYDRNLNGLSAQELIDRFAPARQQAADQDKQALSGQQYQKNKRYKIHKINSFEEARKYGKYNDWCLAQPNGEDMYNQYTADGVNQLYIIVRDDYKTVPKQTGENTPYDDYGLSMMTVIVDGEGHMTQSTTRWNHQNGSSDSALTTKQVSEILGLNFYDTFKPNDTLKKRMEAFDAWLKGQGEKPEGLRIMTALSDNSRIVYFNKKYNIIRPDNTLLLKHWLDYINQTPFSSGLILVIDNDNYNLMDPQTGEMACAEWYDYIAFRESHGFLLVEKEGQKNFIRPDGTLLSNQWFDYADPFTGRFAKVQTQGKGFNLLTTDGKLLSGQWFRAIDQPNSEGFAPVQTLDAPVKSWQTDYDNILRPDGTLLFKEPVDQTFQYEGDWFKVVKDGKQNLVTKDGRLLSQEWFDKIWPNRDDDNLWAKVEKDGKQNIVRPDGSLLSPSLWFDSIFTQGQSIDTPMIASTGGKFNFIAPDGKPVYPRWFDSLDWFRGRYAECRLDGRHGYIDRSGKFYPSRPEESAAERPAGLNETRRIELLRRLVESGKESLYERYKNDQRFRFKATALLAKAGYAVHGTQSRFETFSQDHINGGSRSVYGHGFYFTTEAYKAEEFGLGGEYVFAKISDMALLDLDSPLPEGFEDVCETDMRLREYYSRLENMLDDPAHRGQLTRIWDEMKEVEEGLENLYGSEAERQFYQLLHAALTNYSSSAQAGHIMMHVCKHFPNAFGGEKFVSRMMLSLGYDGWRSGAEIVIWNADKLNANIVRDKDKLLAQILRGGED